MGTKKIKVRIDRKRWLRGVGQGTLLNEEGKMCCLGFWCNQTTGVSLDEMLRIPMPHGVNTALSVGWHAYAAYINDCVNISEEQREAELIELAAIHGEEWEFYN